MTLTRDPSTALSIEDHPERALANNRRCLTTIGALAILLRTLGGSATPGCVGGNDSTCLMASLDVHTDISRME
ncbi:MAG: hypothetical protein JWO18_688 [Microbacteriaceae bacterium]|jgi:hypothetical protein|nr:hypothetical protein [Microbacteriaceae bacterium]